MPDTLEEAHKMIAELKEKNAKVIEEKKEVLKMFDDETLEGMGENERKIAKILEATEIKNAQLAKELSDFKTGIENEKTERVSKQIEERIIKASKGDKAFEDKLRASIDLLDKLPRSTDLELDEVVNSAYRLTGQKQANPLMNGGSVGGTPTIAPNTGFADTTTGKAFAQSLGMITEAKKL